MANRRLLLKYDIRYLIFQVYDYIAIEQMDKRHQFNRAWPMLFQ